MEARSVVKFKGSLPREEPAASILAQVLAMNERAKQAVEDAEGEPDVVGMLANSGEASLDRLLLEDILRAFRDDALGIRTDFWKEGFWSFARECQRTPWLAFYLDDTRRFAALDVRWAGEFDSDDNPPRWLRVPIVFEGVAYSEAADAIMEKCMVGAAFRVTGGRHVEGSVFLG